MSLIQSAKIGPLGPWICVRDVLLRPRLIRPLK